MLLYFWSHYSGQTIIHHHLIVKASNTYQELHILSTMSLTLLWKVFILFLLQYIFLMKKGVNKSSRNFWRHNIAVQADL